MVSVFDDFEEDDGAFLDAMAKLIAVNGDPWSDSQKEAVFEILIDLVRTMQLVHLYRLKYPDHVRPGC